jgi:hypothetical protein
MTAPRMICPRYAFKPRIRHRQDLLLPAGLFGVTSPPGLASTDIRTPHYINPAAMIQRLRRPDTSNHSGGLGVVHGLTQATLSVQFPDLARQWQPVSGPGGRRQWQFQGGDIFLNLDLEVLVLEGDRPQSNDRESVQIFALIMGHELLHVADEIDIVKNWLPPRLHADAFVQRHLSNAQPLDDGMYQRWFVRDEFQTWIHNSVWVPEHNRRGNLRDAAAQYRALNEAINDLRIAQINRPSR